MLPGVNNGKGRGEYCSFSSVHTVIKTYIQIPWSKLLLYVQLRRNDTPLIIPRIITTKCFYLFKCLLFFGNSGVNLQNVFRHFFLLWVRSRRFYGTHIWGVDTWNQKNIVWAITLQVNWGKWGSTICKGIDKFSAFLVILPLMRHSQPYPFVPTTIEHFFFLLLLQWGSE